MKGFFITGTDTGIGKTVLSALLVAALNGAYWKPIQTGAIEGTDRETVRRLAEVPEDRLPPERYVFDPPVSPHLAARQAGAQIALDDIKFPARKRSPLWIVEGAGGVMVPLNGRVYMLDLMHHLRLPVIVATRTTLGTINHTLLTLAALRNDEIPVRGVVMIGTENLENRRAIEFYGTTKVIGQIPILESIDRATLLDVYAKHFEHSAFDVPQDPQWNARWTYS